MTEAGLGRFAATGAYVLLAWLQADRGARIVGNNAMRIGWRSMTSSLSAAAKKI